ncbi:hypothetical protein VST63_20655 [Mycolicibacterium sp. 050232]|uniref:hypothetical protein n=1 Tax=Mycolicibacterium sp. 050232 TaxID=3113982 RepID=UPI002E2AEEE1|nr:hypothetical protein [Mycolicibacterium sp. 050232]MED5814778.1 hypothetical protein [Mycolicibacterium sp. 050232]
MSWPVRMGLGLAVLAALAVGRSVDAALPVEHTDERPFVHTATVGERVGMTFADVTVDGVHTAKALDSVQGTVGTPGRWLVVDLTVVARGRPLSKPGISLVDNADRTFRSDPRSGYDWSAAPTGVRWRAHIPFEVPRDSLAGATLVFSRNATDDRRDDVARIDLGIAEADVEALWATEDTIELGPAGMVEP